MSSPAPKLPIDSVSLAATGNLFSADTRGYCTAVVQLAVGSGTVTWEQSNDGVTWVSCQSYTPANLGTATPSTTATAAGVYLIPCFARFVRARISAYTSGTFSCNAVLDDQPLPALGVYIGAAATLTVTQAAVSAAQGTTTNIVSTAAIIASSIKASAGNLLGYVVSNNSAAAKVLKFYNKASAPVAASDTPVVKVVVPAGATLNILFPESAPMRFATGIALGVTGAIGNTDTTALAADDINITLITV